MKNLFYTILAFLLALPAASAHAILLETGGGGTGGAPVRPGPFVLVSIRGLFPAPPHRSLLRFVSILT